MRSKRGEPETKGKYSQLGPGFNWGGQSTAREGHKVLLVGDPTFACDCNHFGTPLTSQQD